MLQLDYSAVQGQQELADFLEARYRYAIYNKTASSAGLAIGTGSTAKVLIANTVTYTVANIWKSKTTAEIAFTATTMDIAASASSVQEAVYFVCLDASGTPSLVMGTIAAGAGNAKYPELPAATLTVIGAVRIAVAAGSTMFDASSDALSAGHLTVTYYNFATAPIASFSAAL